MIQIIEYKILSGDTLTKISRLFDCEVRDIMRANPYIRDKNKIFEGDIVIIPKVALFVDMRVVAKHQKVVEISNRLRIPYNQALLAYEIAKS